MVGIFFKGIGFGLVLALMIGPVFFGLIQTSISKGFKQGVFYAIGVSISDIVWIFMTYFGISTLLENEKVKTAVTLIGGIITLIFGAYYFFKAPVKSVPLADLPKGKESKKIIWKGFFHNFLNPSVLFFWIATVSIVSVNYSNNPYQIITFFCGILLTLFSADLLKSYIAHKIKAYFTDKILNMTNKVLGIVFIIAGAVILYRIK